MGKRPVRLAASLISLLALSFHVSVNAEASADKAELSRFEKRLFFKTYEDEDESGRLERVEKKVFGQSLSGALEERIQKVRQALGPDRAPESTTPGASPPAAAGQAKPSTQQEYQDPEDAMYQAKMAVMAAREEEVRRLLSAGVELWKAKRGNEAIEKFEQVIRLDPHNAESHFSMGIIYEAGGNYAQALGSYQKAFDARPDNKEYKAAIAEVEKKAAQQEKFEGQSGELKLLAEDAAAAFKRKEYISALDLYKQLDAKIPPTAQIKYNIGTIYLMTSNQESALDYYRQAKKLRPQDPKYTQAVQQLEANLKRDQSERKKAEKTAVTAWNQQQPQSSKSKGPAPKENTRKGQEFLNSLGIIGRSSKDGVVITTIGIASRAAKVGLLQGDVIKACNGTIIKGTDELNDILAKSFGQSVQLTVQRGNQMGQISL